MSVIVLGTWQGEVVYETPRGDRHEIPLAHVSGIQAAIDNGEAVELDPCAQCGDGPGTEPRDGALLVCIPCCSTSQGSIHDDRIEF